MKKKVLITVAGLIFFLGIMVFVFVKREEDMHHAYGEEERLGMDLELMTKTSTFAHADFGAISGALLKYYWLFGEYPTGDGVSVARAITGNNPVGTNFVGRTVDDKGEILDFHKVPFLFEREGEDIIVTSSGHNGVFGDDDDLITRVGKNIDTPRVHYRKELKE